MDDEKSEMDMDVEVEDEMADMMEEATALGSDLPLSALEAVALTPGRLVLGNGGSCHSKRSQD